MIRIKIYLLAILLSVFMYACATTPKPVVQEEPVEVTPPEETKKEVVPDRKREDETLEIFAEILDLVESTEDRQAVLPRIEELYDRIINEYAGTPLAQESYWKLITIYLEDYSPPLINKAGDRYKEFITEYPRSVLNAIIDDTYAKGLYRNYEWARLLELCTPSYTEYVENGKHPRASLLFMYSEANFHLGDLVKAREGYEIVAELFPKIREGQKSVSMLKQIKKKQ